MLSDITAVILAAGQGRRLYPLTRRLPKCLLAVGGLPILHRQLRSLQANGVRNIVLVIGFRGEAVRASVVKFFPGLRVRFIRNRRSTSNTLYSLALAAESFQPKGDVLQLNGDVVFDAELICRLTHAPPGRNFLAVRLGRSDREDMKVRLWADGSIVEINKQIRPSKAAGEAVGINRFSPSGWRKLARVLERLKEGFPGEYFEYAIEQAIAGGMRLLPFDIGTLRAIDIDFPTDLKRAEREMTRIVRGSRPSLESLSSEPRTTTEL